MMKQLSVFIENKKGTLERLTDVLAKKFIDIRAIAVFDTNEFGILRLIVDKPEDAATLLKDEGFVAKISDVVAVEAEDKAGSLHGIFKILDQENINVEYIYSFVMREKELPFIVLKLNPQKEGIEALNKHGIKVVNIK